jgi:poly(hydroxyalkanoate) depolymerase family esterase
MMKSRLLDTMGEALSLVSKSRLADATAVLRNALSGGKVGGAGAPEASPPFGGARHLVAPARRSLGEVLGALRAGRAPWPKTAYAPEKAPSPDAFGDNFTSRSYRGAAGSLNYRLYVPPDHAGRDLALVLMLHGCTQNPEDFALGTHMNGLADEFGLIVAYPHQPRSANSQGCWNWFDKRHQHRGSGEPAKLAGLAQSLANEFGVGRERTFVAGLSAGGAMAEVLAATYPDVFDAVGIHSGIAYKAASDVPSAFAAMKGTAISEPALKVVAERDCRKIIFHGGADATVNPANSQRILDEARRGADSLKQIDLDWRIEAGRVNRTVLNDSAGRAVVEHWFVERGGHAWFGGDARGTYTQSVGLDASRVMVRFFLKQ